MCYCCSPLRAKGWETLPTHHDKLTIGRETFIFIAFNHTRESKMTDTDSILFEEISPPPPPHPPPPTTTATTATTITATTITTSPNHNHNDNNSNNHNKVSFPISHCLFTNSSHSPCSPPCSFSPCRHLKIAHKCST